MEEVKKVTNIKLLESRIAAFAHATPSNKKYAYKALLTAVWLCLFRDDCIYVPMEQIKQKRTIGFNSEMNKMPEGDAAWRVAPMFNDENERAFFSYTSLQCANEKDIHEQIRPILLKDLLCRSIESADSVGIFIFCFDGSAYIPTSEVIRMLDYLNERSDRDILTLEYDGLEAEGEETPWLVAVYAGSDFKETDRDSCPKNIHNRRREITEQGFVKNGEFVCDAVFNSLSMAANCITGGIGNKKLWAFRTKNGNPLDFEYVKAADKYRGEITLSCECGYTETFISDVANIDEWAKNVVDELLNGKYGDIAAKEAECIKRERGKVEISRRFYRCVHCKKLEIRNKVRVLPENKSFTVSCPCYCVDCGRIMGQINFPQLAKEPCPKCGGKLKTEVKRHEGN